MALVVKYCMCCIEHWDFSLVSLQNPLPLEVLPNTVAVKVNHKRKHTHLVTTTNFNPKKYGSWC